jgi:hypothetical protein
MRQASMTRRFSSAATAASGPESCGDPPAPRAPLGLVVSEPR